MKKIINQVNKNFKKTIKIIVFLSFGLSLLTGCKESHEHDFVEKIKVESTCTEKGYIGRKCECGEIEIFKYYEDLKLHIFYTEIIKEPTCVEEGMKLRKCSTCDWEEEIEISRLDHIIKYYDSVEATCQTNGWTEGYSCETCDVLYKERQMTDKVEHKFKNNSCIWCSTNKPSEGLSYSWDDNRQAYIVDGIGTCTDAYLVIPNSYRGYPVYKIKAFAFSGNNKLQSVKFQENSKVEIIGREAFQECENIKDVELPESVVEIGSYAFYRCINMESVNIPQNVIEIEYSTFEGCYKLTNILLPSNLKTINSYAFCQCVKLTEITIPNTVVEIGIRAFNTTGLKEVIFEENSSLEVIQEYAFARTYLTSITLPDSLKKLGYNVFLSSELTEINVGKNTEILLNGLRSYFALVPNGSKQVHNIKTLKKINVSEDNPYFTSIDGVLYSKDMTKLLLCPTSYEKTEFVLPKQVKIIESLAFYDSKMIEFSVEKGSQLEYIYSMSFNNSKSGYGPLRVIDLGNAIRLRDISKNAFSGGFKLTEFKVPKIFENVKFENIEIIKE